MNMNRNRDDRLYELLPVVYRMRDAEQGEPLKALLRIISEQVNLVEDDISQLYENWFVETCQDWVVPYLGDMVGYEPVREVGGPSGVLSPQQREKNKTLIPRREVANTIKYRRCKGTLALLELLSNDVADWPARAAEFYRYLCLTQALNHQRLSRGRLIDIRNGAALDLLNSPFDKSAHNVDIRRGGSRHSQGRHNIPSVGIFVWRLKSYPVSETPAYCLESAGPHCFTFSVLGNDSPLYVRPKTDADPMHIAEEFNLPVPIRRRLFEDHLARLYGPGKSVQIWVGTGKKNAKTVVREPVAITRIIPADLSNWRYLPRRGTVAIDPALGRIAFPTRQFPKNGVWVSYLYGLSMDIGGGEYERPIAQLVSPRIYTVGKDAEYETITAAIEQWNVDSAVNAVIEIADSGVYVERISITFADGQKNLHLRAKNRCRPIIRLLDWQTDRPDSLTVTGVSGSCLTLDGVLVTGRGVQVAGDLTELLIKHSTLVPGWTLDEDCEPQRGTEPSLEILSPNVCVQVEHSILGSIQINPMVPEAEVQDEKQEIFDEAPDSELTLARCQGIGPEVRLDPIRLCISDSILDATDPELEAIGAPGCPVAHASLVLARCTVFGQVQVRSIDLGENSIFDGHITVARRQKGCLRFCYVTPGSRTPRRYHCQPDLAEMRAETLAIERTKEEDLPDLTELQLAAVKQTERLRVRPRFNSVRYGTPDYCQLSNCAADEIRRGADDESEMGVFHDLFQPQRTATLSARIDEYVPAGIDVGILFAS
jgi:hypothetical protein